MLLACGEKPQSDPRTAVPLVRATTVKEAAPATQAYTGTVAARVQSDLGFRVAGKVLERLVDTGQSVKRGQVLMRLDAADLNLASLAQQQAVAAARARARQTAQDEARYRDLRGTGAISALAYDQVSAAAEAAQAQLSAAEAQAGAARNASGYSTLVADADGVVMETLAEAGQVVGAGQAVIRIAHAGRREAVIALPETVRPAIGSTGVATLFGRDGAAASSTAQASSSATSPATSLATLRQLSSTADRLTRTFEARYVLDGELAGAPLGATVTIQIPDASTTPPSTPHSAWSVPLGALFDAGKGPGVWVIQGQPAKVNWRPVTVQRLADDNALVSAQLKQGERIVALGGHLLHEGAAVRVAGQGADAAAQTAIQNAAQTGTPAGAQP